MEDKTNKIRVQALDDALYDNSYVDGQPMENFYAPAVMTDIDVIENILSKYSKAGVTHKFSGDDLIITAGTTSHFNQEKVLDDLRYTLAEVMKELKKQYKEATGKTLSIEKEKASTIDVTSNYTTGHMGLYKVINTYELPNSPSSDDASLEKHEVNEMIDQSAIDKELNPHPERTEKNKKVDYLKTPMHRFGLEENEGDLAPKDVKCPKCGNRTGSGNSGGDIEDEGAGNWYCNACGKIFPKR